MKYRSLILAAGIAAGLSLTGCGNSGDTNTANTSTATGSSLSADQLKNGIGPIRSVQLSDEPDDALAAKGEPIFTTKCAICHKMSERYVGPPLGDVLTRRTPPYIMNMILNPAEMIEKHPEARAMLAQFMNPMPFQNVTEEDARAILEFLRTQQIATDDEEDEEDEDHE